MLKHLSKERLREILDRSTDRRIGVVGDLGLDAYWYADMTRSFLSRETPHFPRPVVREVYTPGAGANVVHNLSVLGVGQVVVFSVLGDDWRGAILRQEMACRGILVEHLIISPQRSTTTFVKPILLGYDSQQEDGRLDFENAEPLDPVGAGDTFIAALATTLAAGAMPWEAGAVTNLAAAVIVEKLNQTGTASAGGNSGPLRSGRDKGSYSVTQVVTAADGSTEFAKVLPSFSWLELINPSVCLGRVHHALFDFDGTISVIRRGWERI